MRDTKRSKCKRESAQQKCWGASLDSLLHCCICLSVLQLCSSVPGVCLPTPPALKAQENSRPHKQEPHKPLNPSGYPVRLRGVTGPTAVFVISSKSQKQVTTKCKAMNHCHAEINTTSPHPDQRGETSSFNYRLHPLSMCLRSSWVDRNPDEIWSQHHSNTIIHRPPLCLHYCNKEFKLIEK